MKRRDALRSLALAPLAAGWDLRPAPASGPAANAVDAYRAALDRLPALTDIEKTTFENAATAPLDPTARGLVERATPALECLARGASAPACEWGDTWTGDGFDGVTDWIMKARSLARLASLRARIAIEAGRTAAGVDDAIAALTFGRHIGRGLVFIAQVIGMAIEHGTIEAVAAALPRLDRAALTSLDARYLALTAMPDLPATIRGEKAFYLGYYVPRNRDEVDDAKARDCSAWYDRLAAACTDTAALDAMRAEARSHAQRKQFFEVFDSMRKSRVYASVKGAMFRAAIVIVGDGPKAVDRVPDPFDGRPFDLRTWASGFELTSRFALDGKPNAALIVGKRA